MIESVPGTGPVHIEPEHILPQTAPVNGEHVTGLPEAPVTSPHVPGVIDENTPSGPIYGDNHISGLENAPAANAEHITGLPRATDATEVVSNPSRFGEIIPSHRIWRRYVAYYKKCLKKKCSWI